MRLEAKVQLTATAIWRSRQVYPGCLRLFWTSGSQGYMSDPSLGTCTDLWWWHRQGQHPSTPWFHFWWAQLRRASLSLISAATSNWVCCNQCQALRSRPQTSLGGTVLCFSLLARMLRYNSRHSIRHMDQARVTLKALPRRTAQFGGGILRCMALYCLGDQDLHINISPLPLWTGWRKFSISLISEQSEVLCPLDSKEIKLCAL